MCERAIVFHPPGMQSGWARGRRAVTRVAIIGAGPYGLSIAAHLRSLGVDYRIFGRPLDTWRRQMPAGMMLKSDGFASNLSAPAGEGTLAVVLCGPGHPVSRHSRRGEPRSLRCVRAGLPGALRPGRGGSPGHAGRPDGRRLLAHAGRRRGPVGRLRRGRDGNHVLRSHPPRAGGPAAGPRDAQLGAS